MNKHPIHIFTIACFMLAFVLADIVVGQGYNVGPISVQGSAGFSSELYGVSGIDSRRPWGSGRVFARLQAEGLGFHYGLDMNLSTEQSSIRQNLNQLGINFSYQWLTFAAGDVRPVYSDYSVNGVNIRGSSVEATPGNWTFSAAGGRSQRAISPTEERPALSPLFARWLYAARAGYNASSNKYLHLVGTYGRDATTSLDQAVRSSFQITPAENSTLSTLFGTAFFENRFHLDGTFTWAHYNGNFSVGPAGRQNSSPQFFDDAIGSHSDYAGKINLRYSESSYNINTSYERVQPGFISMGLPFIRNDQEQIQVRPQFYLLNRRVRIGLDYLQARNNLSGQLINTNHRNHAGFNTQTRISDNLNLSGSYRIMLNRVVPRDHSSTTEMRQVTHNIALTPTYNWQSGSVTNNIQVSANIQFFDMEQRAGNGTIRSDFTNLTTSLNYSASLESGLSISPGLTHVLSRSAPSNLDAIRSQLSLSKDFLERLITVAVSSSYTHNRTTFGGDTDRPGITTEQFSINVNTGYRLPIGDYLRLNIRGLVNSASAGASFSEVQATLQFNHRF